MELVTKLRPRVGDVTTVLMEQWGFYGYRVMRWDWII